MAGNDFRVNYVRQAAAPLGPFLLTLYTAPVAPPPPTTLAIPRPLYETYRDNRTQTSASKRHLVTLLQSPSVPDATFAMGANTSMWFTEPRVQVSYPPQAILPVLTAAPAITLNQLGVPLVNRWNTDYFPPAPPAQIGVNNGWILGVYTFPVYVPPTPPDPPPVVDTTLITQIRVSFAAESIVIRFEAT